MKLSKRRVAIGGVIVAGILNTGYWGKLREEESQRAESVRNEILLDCESAAYVLLCDGTTSGPKVVLTMRELLHVKPFVSAPYQVGDVVDTITVHGSSGAIHPIEQAIYLAGGGKGFKFSKRIPVYDGLLVGSDLRLADFIGVLNDQSRSGPVTVGE